MGILKAKWPDVRHRYVTGNISKSQLAREVGVGGKHLLRVRAWVSILLCTEVPARQQGKFSQFPEMAGECT